MEWMLSSPTGFQSGRKVFQANNVDIWSSGDAINFLMTGSYSAADSLSSEKSYFEAQAKGQVRKCLVIRMKNTNVMSSFLETALPTARSVQCHSSNTSDESNGLSCISSENFLLKHIELIFYMFMVWISNYVVSMKHFLIYSVCGPYISCFISLHRNLLRIYSGDSKKYIF